MNEDRFSLILGVLAVLVGILLFAAKGCTDPDRTRKALEGAGYRDITTGGYSFGGCSDSDQTCTEFTATGPTGVKVAGQVGCGWWFKGCTIRTN